MKRLFGFTLAETLIVMGIIGVVAALTLPNLNSSTGNKEKVAKVKKIYQNLNDAFGRVEAIYGPYTTWNAYGPANSKTYDRLSEFLKVSKHCAPNETGCFVSNTFKSLKSGYIFTDNIAPYHKIILADGAAVAIFPYDKCYNNVEGNYCGNFYVDIDGPNKGTNTLGKDIFVFIWTDMNGVVPCGINGYEFKWGNSAAAWVINNDNMDYLNVDVNGKCNNNSSITLNETVTSCK
ncbi:type II secretion system protein [bacterium]|nr:type II secretion system protein [bacterium]